MAQEYDGKVLDSVKYPEMKSDFTYYFGNQGPLFAALYRNGFSKMEFHPITQFV